MSFNGSSLMHSIRTYGSDLVKWTQEAMTCQPEPLKEEKLQGNTKTILYFHIVIEHCLTSWRRAECLEH